LRLKKPGTMLSYNLRKDGYVELLNDNKIIVKGKLYLKTINSILTLEVKNP